MYLKVGGDEKKRMGRFTEPLKVMKMSYRLF